MFNYQSIIDALQSLTVYRNILADPAVRAYLDHLSALAGTASTAHPAYTYGKVHHLLAATVNPMQTADAWQNHLLDLILDDVNPFSRAAFTPGGDYAAHLPAAQRDLRILQLAAQTNARQVLEDTVAELPNHPLLPDHLEQLPLWAASRPAGGAAAGHMTRRLQMKETIFAAPQWDKLAERLAAHYAEAGCGIFGRFIAFKWQNGSLHGVEHPDPVALSDLIGYEDVREQVIRNTLQFLQGYPANNMLLYGDRGTGKSSTVKALLNEFWPRGLRLVEVPKQELANFPAIAGHLRRLRHRFILFVDDLSFEENETDYKFLKALLEGGLEPRPANVLIYATSNRRHLVKETFADRQAQEVRSMDTLQEKLSLADRFGITVIFPTPDQQLFLKIVAGLAQKRNLPLKPEQLRQRALQWSAWHNGRSPRAARQLVDQLEGELAMARSGG